MEINAPNNIILSIESAIGGGSLSLLRDAETLASTSGRAGVSRAEDLLLNIAEILEQAEVKKWEIDTVAVSVGPGSFTGLRIGIATAIGLATALEKPCVGVPLFESIARASGSLDTAVIAAPLGRSDICFQFISAGMLEGSPRVASQSDFLDLVRDKSGKLIYHAAMGELLSTIQLPDKSEFIELGSNMAEFVGRYAATHPKDGGLEPIYVQNPRFV